MPNKVNKGEWAELFVFLKALADGKIHAADENLKKVDALFYRILSAMKSEQDILKEYRAPLKTSTIKRNQVSRLLFI